MYHTLDKERPWMEHLTSPPKGKVGMPSSVSSFNHGRAPMSSLRQLDAPKHIIGQTIMHNRATSGFEVKFWQHTTLWTVLCHCEHGVARGIHHINDVCLYKAMKYNTNLCTDYLAFMLQQIVGQLSCHSGTGLFARHAVQLSCHSGCL